MLDGNTIPSLASLAAIAAVSAGSHEDVMHSAVPLTSRETLSVIFYCGTQHYDNEAARVRPQIEIQSHDKLILAEHLYGTTTAPRDQKGNSP